MQEEIIVVQGKNSKWFTQAVFILKAGQQALPVNLVSEAEKIIEDYMDRKLNPQKYISSQTTESSKQVVQEECKPVKKISPHQNRAKTPSVIETNLFVRSMMYLALISTCVFLGYYLTNF